MKIRYLALILAPLFSAGAFAAGYTGPGAQPITTVAAANEAGLGQALHALTGSVHAAAWAHADGTLFAVREDVGRHNAVDTIAGWIPLQTDLPPGDKIFYTTGRLTSEMVIKSAQMGIPVVVSRSGITQMGLDVAKRLGLCAIGRATNKRFLCFSAPERLVWQPELAQ